MNLWGAWQPDVGGPNSGRAEQTDGVIPQTTAQGLGYGPYPALVTASGAAALSGAPVGLVSLQRFDGSWTAFAATSTTIAELQSDYSWSNIETGRTVPADYDVSFLHFGSYLLNTDATDGFKAYNVETPAGNNAVSGAPAAAFIFSCNNVVFALNCDGNNRRMESSGQGDHTNWTGEGADGKTFEDGGELICGGDLKNGAGIILQESAARFIQFGQGPGLYSLNKLAGGRGCVGARTFVAFDGVAYWWDTDGPWQFSAGTGLVPIGAEKINRWAEREIGPELYRDMQASVDPARSLVMWRVNDTSLLAYNWLLREWSTLPATTTALARIATPAVTIDSINDQIDTVDIAFDSRFWAGTEPLLGGLDTSYKFALFSGGAMPVTLKGCKFNSPTSDLINWAQLIDDASDGTLQIGYADDLATEIAWKTGAERVRGGWVPLRARGNVIQFQRNIPAGSAFTYAAGIDNINGRGK